MFKAVILHTTAIACVLGIVWLNVTVWVHGI